MDAGASSPDESQPLLDENNRRLLRRRSAPLGTAIHSSGQVFHAATKALRESNTGWLLILMPLGIIFSMLNWNPLATLLFNIGAIIPLSALVSGASDQLCDHIGELMGGLVNATFGNTVELIVGILAVAHGEINVAQSMMVGSILSDILLILGICVVASTYGKKTVEFNKNATGVLCSLMTITVVVLIIPAFMYSAAASSHPANIDNKIVLFSRGAAIILLLLYALYLYFNLRSHSFLFLDKPDNIDTACNPPTASDFNEQADDDNENDNDVSTLWIACIMLLIGTVAIFLCTHLILDTLDSVTNSTRITKRFATTILLPISSNAPELTAIIAKTKEGRVSFAVSVVVSSILQIALFVIPILVVLGWVIHESMTLNFEVFLITLLFLAVLAVNRLLKDGVYTYLHGCLLMQLYFVMALIIYIRPDVQGKK